jgi:uncharacterized protein
MTAGSSSDAVAAVIEEGRRTRTSLARRRVRLALVLPATITVVWVVAVTSFGLWPRVIDRWPATVTMMFGGFVAGSTPQGGAAVAFPVFTKVLEAPPEVARSMGLSIQVIGMGCASTAIIVRRVPVAWRAIGLVLGPALAGLAVALLLVSNLDRPFAPSVLPGPYVKVAFTVALGAMAATVLANSRRPVRERRSTLGTLNGRSRAAIVVGGLLGGFVAGLTGSGADGLFFVVLVVLLGVDPRVGVPSSVIVMASLSLVGLLALGVGDGHLRVELSPDRKEVVGVGGQEVALVDGTLAERPPDGEGTDPAPAQRFDLLGLWLAAIPAVAWAGPLGAAVAARLTDRILALFLASLALAEVVSTAVFLEDLRTDRVLAAFFVLGTLGAILGLRWASANRHRLFDLQPWDPSRPVTHLSVITTGSYPRWGRAMAAEAETGAGAGGAPSAADPMASDPDPGAGVGPGDITEPEELV